MFKRGIRTVQRQPKIHVEPKLKEGDLVLIKDHTAKAFQPSPKETLGW